MEKRICHFNEGSTVGDPANAGLNIGEGSDVTFTLTGLQEPSPAEPAEPTAQYRRDESRCDCDGPRTRDQTREAINGEGCQCHEVQ